MKQLLLAAILLAFLASMPNAQACDEHDKTGKVPLYPIVQDGRWGYMDNKGAIVIQPQFDKADAFKEGMAAVKLGKQVGYIDETGKIIINPQFEDGWAFDHGVAPVKMRGKLGYINKTGEFIWKPGS